MKRVQIIADGSCELSGGEAQTTNNRMELMAAINGLILGICHEFHLAGLAQGFLKHGILARWRTNGWRTSNRKPVQNQDLWRELDAQAAKHRTHWTWTKGHADHDDNNRCDELATQAARSQR
jgi:ribonuclease HI